MLEADYLHNETNRCTTTADQVMPLDQMDECQRRQAM